MYQRTHAKVVGAAAAGDMNRFGQRELERRAVAPVEHLVRRPREDVLVAADLAGADAVDVDRSARTPASESARIGARLTEARVARGLEQKALAARLGMMD